MRAPPEGGSLVPVITWRTLVHHPRHEAGLSFHRQGASAADFLRSRPFLRTSGATWGNRARFHRTIVTALNVLMILVARNQQNSMPACLEKVATRRCAIYRDLPAIINGFRKVKLHAGPRRDQGVQVHHRAVFPQNRTTTSAKAKRVAVRG